MGVQIVFLSDGCKMTRGSMVLAKGVRMGTLYKLDACTIQCNSASVKSKKRALDSSLSLANQEKKRTQESNHSYCQNDACQYLSHDSNWRKVQSIRL